jgi:hypothetical protein
MTIFTAVGSLLAVDEIAIDGTIEGDTLHVGSVMSGRLRPGDWLRGAGHEDFMIERQIASRRGHSDIPESIGSYMITFASEMGIV